MPMKTPAYLDGLALFLAFGTDPVVLERFVVWESGYSAWAAADILVPIFCDGIAAIFAVALVY